MLANAAPVQRGVELDVVELDVVERKACAAAASAGPPSPSKFSSATLPGNLVGGGPGGAFAHAHAAGDVSFDTSCKEDYFCDDENDALHQHHQHHHHYPGRHPQHQHRPPVPSVCRAPLGPAAAAAVPPSALPVAAVAAPPGDAALLQRTGSFTSRMNPLPKEHPHDPSHDPHQQQQQQHYYHQLQTSGLLAQSAAAAAAAAPDAPRWRPRPHHDDQRPPQQQPQQQPPAADAEAEDLLLACGAAPLLSCCEALDLHGGTPLPAAAAAAEPPAAAPAAAAEAAASDGRSPLPLPDAPPRASSASPARAAPAGSGFNAEVVLQLRNELLREAGLRPSPDCLGAHGPSRAPADQFVTPQMRAIVVSWLSEVASEFALQQETLFASVSLLDRFLSATDAVPRSVLQLAAVASCLVACKQDECGGAASSAGGGGGGAPGVDELVDVAAGCFRREDLLRMERILLDALGWRVRAPTSYTFLHLIGQALPRGLQPAAAALACYLTELAGLDYASLAAPPSAVAGAALLLAQASTAAEVGEGGGPCAAGAAAAVQWREVSALTGHAAGDLARLAAHLLGLQQQAERDAAAAFAAAGGAGAGDCSPAAAADAAAGGSSSAPSAFVREKYAAPAWLCASVARPPLEAFGPPPPWAHEQQQQQV